MNTVVANIDDELLNRYSPQGKKRAPGSVRYQQRPEIKLSQVLREILKVVQSAGSL